MTSRRFHAPIAFLADGWARNVAIDVDAAGTIDTVEANVALDGEMTRLAGPVLPGIVNIHSHAFQRAMAGLAEHTVGHDDSFWTWRERMYGLVGQLTPEQVGVIARYSFIQMLKGGYTGVAEFHYLHHDSSGRPYAEPSELSQRILRAANEAGLPITLLPTLYTYGDFGGQPATPGQRRFLHQTDDFLSLLETVDGCLQTHQQAGLAFHSLRAVASDQIMQVLAARRETGPIHIHVAEQQREVDACLAWSGQRPVTWLLDHIPVDARWCLIHSTHLTDAERRRLASSPVTVGLCPTTEASLGDGIFSAMAFADAGGRFAVGSDSQVNLTPTAELRLIEYKQRLVQQKRNRLHGNGEVGNFLYRMAAEAGARAAAQPTGAIEAGRRADFVVLDEDQPMLAGCQPEQIASCWLFAGDERWIRDVWIAGEPVVSAHRHAREDDAAAAMRRVMAELRDRL